MTILGRAVLAAVLLLLAASAPRTMLEAPATAQQVTPSATPGRVLASTRGQVAWLSLTAPRPTLLTQLVSPAYPADVAAARSASFAVASVVTAFPSADPRVSTMGADLLAVDLESGATRQLLQRQSRDESLDLPAFWPDGSTIVFQRSNLRAQLAMPGQAQPQYESRLEQVGLDGNGRAVLLDDARYPAPAPDGKHLAFVRTTQRGTGLFVHSIADADAPNDEVVAPGQFLALAYPSYSPDGRQLAFAAISPLSPIGQSPAGHLLAFLAPGKAAKAHGFPWDAWLVNTDGSNLRQITDVIDDDPSITWSPDGTQLLVYGGWGSYLVDAASGSADLISYLAGYGSVAWLPD